MTAWIKNVIKTAYLFEQNRIRFGLQYCCPTFVLQQYYEGLKAKTKKKKKQ